MGCVSLQRVAWLGVVGLAICGWGCGSKAEPPASTEAAKVEEILGQPAGCNDAINKSGELYRAGKDLESIAVLDAFAKAHPKFADVEIHLGSSELTVAAQRQLFVDAGSFANEVLQKDPKNSNALEIKTMILEGEARLKK